ncbi:MAG: carboxypeptidase-like regulatory domain-containing protein [Rikenellaceae bacterium]
MRRTLLTLICTLLISAVAFGQNQRYNVRGEVYDHLSRQSIPYATIVVEGLPSFGGSADSLGRFEIVGLPAGIYRFEAYSLGHEPAISAEYIISAKSSPIEIAMEESARKVDSVVVVRSLLSRVAQSPVSMRQIGLQLLERTAGANRDLSKVVQSFPGVAFSPASYRNDLIVRGGSPSENRFYVDGFELPNINHFSTQGASGGPVGLINADLVRQIDLYSGAFPVNTDGALSSVLDIELRDGDKEQQKFKATLGASEVGLSGSGHFDDKSTYIFSARRSYLQLLFSALGLPFLPDYIDAQFKSRTKLSNRDEITFLFVGALDDMTLNENATTSTAEYLLGYLPTIKQNTLTVGASYRHFDGSNSYALYLSHSYVYNSNIKYASNDDSSAENLTLKLKSSEQWTTLRNENRSYLGDWTLRYGAKVGYNGYSVDSFTPYNSYESSLGYGVWGVYAGGEYIDPDERFTSSLGVRADGSSYSSRTAQLWRYLSPRGALSVALNKEMSLNLSSGLYFQLPEFTSLSYAEQGEYVNSDLSYCRVWESTLGVDYRPQQSLKMSLEAFYKDYGNLLLSVEDNIPLSDKGDDFGTVGNELLSQSVDGRAYGVELMARWQIPSKLSAVASLTLFRSEYRTDQESGYRPSAWDNQFILNASCTYNMPRNWSVAAKVGAVGGAPYTPYDIDQTSLVEVWDSSGTPQRDYTLHHTMRQNNYWQVDLRVDKNYYYERWSMGFYIDIQNLFVEKFVSADIPISTGEIINPTAEVSEQRYSLKYLKSESGVLLPTLGIFIEF